MYDEWGNFAWPRVAWLVLALAGAVFLGGRLLGGEESRISGWAPRGVANVAAAAPAPPAAGLSGLAQQQGQGLPDDKRPTGNPLGAPNTVMTQGYGVGSHAPAETWGGIDLAIDGDGDSFADPQGTMGHPIYATHDGVAKVTPNSYPAGNHVWIENDQYRTGFAHLSEFAVTTGQQVRRGDVIGYVGSTGMSSGPHLHYDTWVKQGGAWVNVNPLDYGTLGS